MQGDLLTFHSRPSMVFLRCFRFSGKLPFSCGYTFRGSALCRIAGQEGRLKSSLAGEMQCVAYVPLVFILRGGPKLHQAWTLDLSHDGAGGKGGGKGSLAAAQL